jgi:hypothetical protein
LPPYVFTPRPSPGRSVHHSAGRNSAAGRPSPRHPVAREDILRAEPHIPTASSRHPRQGARPPPGLPTPPESARQDGEKIIVLYFESREPARPPPFTSLPVTIKVLRADCPPGRTCPTVTGAAALFGSTTEPSAERLAARPPHGLDRLAACSTLLSPGAPGAGFGVPYLRRLDHEGTGTQRAACG